MQPGRAISEMLSLSSRTTSIKMMNLASGTNYRKVSKASVRRHIRSLSFTCADVELLCLTAMSICFSVYADL